MYLGKRKHQSGNELAQCRAMSSQIGPSSSRIHSKHLDGALLQPPMQLLHEHDIAQLGRVVRHAWGVGIIGREVVDERRRTLEVVLVRRD